MQARSFRTAFSVVFPNIRNRMIRLLVGSLSPQVSVLRGQSIWTCSRRSKRMRRWKPSARASLQPVIDRKTSNLPAHLDWCKTQKVRWFVREREPNTNRQMIFGHALRLKLVCARVSSEGNAKIGAGKSIAGSWACPWACPLPAHYWYDKQWTVEAGKVFRSWLRVPERNARSSSWTPSTSRSISLVALQRLLWWLDF